MQYVFDVAPASPKAICHLFRGPALAHLAPQKLCVPDPIVFQPGLRPRLEIGLDVIDFISRNIGRQNITFDVGKALIDGSFLSPEKIAHCGEAAVAIHDDASAGDQQRFALTLVLQN